MGRGKEKARVDDLYSEFTQYVLYDYMTLPHGYALIGMDNEDRSNLRSFESIHCP